MRSARSAGSTTPTPDASAQPIGQIRRTAAAVNLWTWRVVMVLFSLGMLTQVTFAGSYLQGTYDAITWHGMNAGILSLGPMCMIALALLHALLARGPGWPVLASVVLLMALFAQLAIGYAKVMVLHVPLGTVLVAVTFALTWWVFTPAARRAGRLWRRRREVTA